MGTCLFPLFSLSLLLAAISQLLFTAFSLWIPDQKPSGMTRQGLVCLCASRFRYSLPPSHFPLLLMLFLCALRVLCGAKSFAFAPSSLYILATIYCFQPLDSRSKDLWNDEDGTCLFPLFSLSLFTTSQRLSPALTAFPPCPLWCKIFCFCSFQPLFTSYYLLLLALGFQTKSLLE